MEQEIIRGFFSLDGVNISKTMKSHIGALTLIEAQDTISIMAAHCGWDLTADEAAYFRTLVDSVRNLQKNTLSDRDFAAKFFDCTVEIKSFSNKIKGYGTGRNLIKVFHIKDGNQEKWLVSARSVFKSAEDYKLEEINWLKRIKEILQSDFSDPNLVVNRVLDTAKHQEKPADLMVTNLIADRIVAQPQGIVNVASDTEEEILSKLMGSPKFKSMVEKVALETIKLDSHVSSVAPVRYITMKEPRLASTTRLDFNRFREEVMEHVLYPGCLQYWIPNNLIAALSLVWNKSQDVAQNELEIMQLLQGDADRALNVINNKLHDRDRTAGINMLAIKVNKEGKAPRVEEWFEAVTTALKMVGNKDDDQSKIETILNEVASTFPSVRNSFTNRHGLRAWKKLPINEFLVECRQYLADIRLAVENEFVNQRANQFDRSSKAYGNRNSYGKFFSMGSNEQVSNQSGIGKRVTMDIASNRVHEEEEVEDSESEDKMQTSKNPRGSSAKEVIGDKTKKKWCFACKSKDPDHIWQECPKLDPTALHFPDRIKQYNDFLEEKKLKEIEEKTKKRKETEAEGKQKKNSKKVKGKEDE